MEKKNRRERFIAWMLAVVMALATVNMPALTLEVNAEEEKVTVTFDTGGGTEIASQTIEKGQKATKPEKDPEKGGHLFDGWYSDSECNSVFNFENTIAEDTTIYAKWKEAVTITFDTQGGKEIPSQTIEKDTKVTRPDPDPEKDGHLFDGWYSDSNCTESFDFNSKITEDKTIYAKWLEAVTITFNTQGGTEIASQTIEKGQTATAPETEPTKRGYDTFEGWFTAAEDGEEFNFSTAIETDTEIYAQWGGLHTYSITCDPKGGTFAEGKTNREEYNVETKSFRLNNPTKDGYIFAGWSTPAGTGLRTSVTIDPSNESFTLADLTYTANWTEAKTVTFETNGGSNIKTQQIMTGGTAVRPASPTKAGYTFEDWYTDEETTNIFDFDSEIEKNTTLYAKWNLNTYKITYNLAGGTLADGETNPEDYTVERETFTLNNPKKEGYIFDGWTQGEDTEKIKTVMIEMGSKTGDLTYTAHWKKEDYEIQYVGLAGSDFAESNPNPESYDVETDTITLKNPQKTGYTFVGWTGENETEPRLEVKIEKGSTGDLTYTANWTKDEYIIQYGGLADSDFAEEESNPNPKSYDVETDTITLKNPQKTGYTFAGWTGENETEPQLEVKIEKGSSGNLTYTANWTKDEYIIQYGGLADSDFAEEESNPNPKSYDVETDTITLKNPQKTGYTFVGWTGENETEPQLEVKIEKGSSGNLTYTANWAKDEYIIQYGGLADSDFAEEESNPNPKSYDVETDIITLKNPQKTGYTFAGWTDENETNPQLEVKIEKGSTGNRSYTANWTENGISVEVANGTYIYNESAQEPDVTVKDVVTGQTLAKNTDYTVAYSNNINAGEATVKVTGIGTGYQGRENSATFEIEKATLTPKYTVTAYCGDKVSDIIIQPDGVKGQFKWNYTGTFTADTKVVEEVTKDNTTAEVTAYATFEPENQNYKTVDKVEIKFTPVHDFDKLTHLTHENAVTATEEAAGHREYYYCETCNQYFDAKKQSQAKEYFTIPYVKDSITVTLGSTVKIAEYVKNGEDGVASQILSNPSTYANYLTFDETTGTIKTPKKYYKKTKLKNPTITVTDNAGTQYKVKVNLQIKKPTVKITRKSYTSVNGIKSYKYTIKCSAPEADGITLIASSGLAKTSIKTKLNKFLKTNSKKKIKVTKKKASGTITFTIAKSSIKKNKITFQAVGQYGKNKSAVWKKAY